MSAGTYLIRRKNVLPGLCWNGLSIDAVSAQSSVLQILTDLSSDCGRRSSAGYTAWSARDTDLSGEVLPDRIPADALHKALVLVDLA